ncbi:MAG: NF038122 family metalloprotease, partial [Planctomycetes bacterium]|nr:NF038122 family metalloprotease [Planctomycetota bacterium]
YDFDRSNGINASQVDFVGVAAHEIGHLLGFYSGVDNLDFNAMAPGKNDNEFLAVTALDLFRFSSRSIGAGSGIGVIDWTADSTPKYISVDGGLTLLAALSTGENFGDGYQASHWKNNLGLGIMDPTISSGEFVSILPNDLVAFDMIGYDLTPTPEPSFCLLLGFLGILAIALIRSRPRPEHLTSTPAA